MIFCFHFNLHTANLSVLDPILINLLLLISPAQVIISPQKFNEVKSLQVSSSLDLYTQLTTELACTLLGHITNDNDQT